ncbi:hypothetical protein RB195_009993 [Necator americanus]|uniref:Uncharacterized protein n=1 Tax=Necator americanus TaxID=51031 RepID=A0ABR1CVW9_NECAM
MMRLTSICSCAGIINEILERNTDSVIEKMVLALKTKTTQEVADGVETEKSGRSIVITGLAEMGADRSLIERQRDLEEKVANVFDALELDCLPEVAYRLGKFNGNKPRLVKVVLPSRSHWARAHLLRRLSFSNIFVRKSMTAAERKRDYELRHEARLRNERSSTREWMVYKDTLTHITELPRKPMTGNL